MSLKTILKNVYSYIDILQTACSEKVQAWDKQAVDNALQWASYCQQIYLQADGKPYQHELDEHIKNIGQLPWAIGNKEISLHGLKDAVTSLKQALLSNPHLSSSSFEHLLLSYGPLDNAPELLLKDLNILKESKYENDVTNVCLSAITEERLNSGKSSVQASAKLLLEHADMLLTKKPSRKQQCEEMLQEKLKTVGKDSKGLEIICVACSMPHKGKETSRTFFMTWLLQEPQPKYVFELNCDLLAEVCFVHFPFFRAYLKYLVNLTKQAQCDINEEGVEYRLPGEIKFSDFANRLLCLVTVGDPVSSATLKTAESLTMSDNTGIWGKLLHQLHTVSKQNKDCTGIG